MVYAQITFLENINGVVENGLRSPAARTITFKKGEKYEVDVVAERGRTADFRFMVVPDGSAVEVGELGKDVSTAVLSVNLGSYIEHKKAKMALSEEN